MIHTSRQRLSQQQWPKDRRDAAHAPDAALQRTLDDVPGLARITLTNAAGATLNQAERMGTVARDTVRVPIAVAGESLGAIAITTAPAELAAAFEGYHEETLNGLKEQHGSKFTWDELKIFKASLGVADQLSQ